MRLFLVTIFFSLVLLTGALGLKGSLSECHNDPNLQRESEMMNCYHTVAITQAHLGNTAAISSCRSIWTDFGASYDNEENDVSVKAETSTNTCFYDIALIMKDPGVCGYITQWRTSAAQTKLFGEDVTQQRCVDEAYRRAQIAPERYFSTSDNICAIVFVFPLLFLKIFF